MQPTVYLAGPITGLNFYGATSWRDYATNKLASHGIKAWSPMRAKEYLASLPAISGHGKEYADFGAFATSRGVMTRDFYDCTRCDLTLVNFLGATQPSVGTCMEIAWCYMKRTPVIVARDPHDEVHGHMMLREAYGFELPTLESALDHAIAILV
jgi:hypothetical protein